MTLGEAVRVWAKIGFLSFGGPAGQIALMHRILVEEKKWLSEARFLHALNFCMLLPGPEAQQLATYAGWLLHGTRGGLIAGLLFILPGMFVIFALCYVYVLLGSVSVVVGLFVGLKAAVIVIVLQAVFRMGKRSIRSAGPASLAIGAFLAMWIWQVPFPLVVAAAAVLGAIMAGRIEVSQHGNDTAASNAPDPRPVDQSKWQSPIVTVAVFGGSWLLPTIILALLLGPENVFTQIGAFFSKMAVVTFGGAYAVLAYVNQEAVLTYNWLAPGEMIDGLAMAETTPGPLILVTQFVGFVAAYRQPGVLQPGIAGLLGGLLTTWVTFAPCFLWIFVGAPFMERLRKNRILSAALAGVTAAVVGVIAHLGLWFTLHALFDATADLPFAGGAIKAPVLESLRSISAAITMAAGVMVFRFRASVPVTLAATGALGIVSAFL